jgi:hypothetical protein
MEIEEHIRDVPLVLVISFFSFFPFFPFFPLNRTSSFCGPANLQFSIPNYQLSIHRPATFTAPVHGPNARSSNFEPFPPHLNCTS